MKLQLEDASGFWLWEDGSRILLEAFYTGPTPPERILAIRADPRTLAVPREHSGGRLSMYAINDHFVKDPDAVLDYKFDWKALSNGSGLANWLASSETITSEVVTVPAGITLDSEVITDSATSVTAWLSGGTVGRDYDVACRIVTSAGRTDERTITITVRQR